MNELQHLFGSLVRVALLQINLDREEFVKEKNNAD